MNTVDKLRKQMPDIKNDELEIIDREIKRFIASIEEDFYVQTAEHINITLQKYNRYGKDNFLKKCKRLAKIYLKNENAWVAQENKVILKWVIERFSKKEFHFEWKKLVHAIYQIISVISTLAIFTGVLYFVIGKVTNNNQSDNDLIMRQIKADTSENQQIVNIEVEDIHGFGNDSIIVTTVNENMSDEGDNNKLIILETVENEILNSMNYLFGLKSNYRITFSYGLSADDMRLYPNINCVSDILGDSAKEILIDYYVWGSTYGAYYTAVYKYSYESEKYELVGSYPIVNKHDVSKYDEEGNILSSMVQDVDTKFDVLPCEDENIHTFTDYEKSFNLTLYSYYCRDYWAEFSNLGKVLVVVKRDKWEEEALINVYFASYDEAEGKLGWRVIYSETTTDLSDDYTKDELAKWMENKFDCRVNMY